jgi:plastocyanin domain-containing protein
MEKSTLYGFAIFFLMVFGGYFFLQGGVDAGTTGNAVALNGEIQEVTIGMKNYNYNPNVVKVGVGKTVRIRLDDSVYGCFRDFTVREFGVRKYLRGTDDYVEFVPDKKGTFTFSCSMGMGVGKLVVE